MLFKSRPLLLPGVTSPTSPLTNQNICSIIYLMHGKAYRLSVLRFIQAACRCPPPPLSSLTHSPLLSFPACLPCFARFLVHPAETSEITNLKLIVPQLFRGTIPLPICSILPCPYVSRLLFAVRHSPFTARRSLLSILFPSSYSFFFRYAERIPRKGIPRTLAPDPDQAERIRMKCCLRANFNLFTRQPAFTEPRL
jgi:hypothetical protein